MISISPIGKVRTDFKEKFGVPRQSGMIPEARGIIKLNPDPAFHDALRGLESFSHLWIIFQFHEHADSPWRPLTTPPRLDAPGRVGVFASRSPHRPNNIGMSAVKLDGIDFQAKGGIEIRVSGVDLLDETPVLDLKPYVPFVDSIPDASGAWTETAIPKYAVQFTSRALEQLEQLQVPEAQTRLKFLITQMLELDPRPTSQKKAFPLEDVSNEKMAFGFRVAGVDVKFEISGGGFLVVSLVSEA